MDMNESSSSAGKKADRSAVPSNVNVPNSDCLPVTFVDTELGAVGEAPRESAMTPSECKKAWVEMFKAWNVRTDSTKMLLINTVLLYFVRNGSSARGQFTANLVVESRQYPTRVIRSVLGDGVRRFARAHADLTREVLSANPKFAKEQANRYGVSLIHKDVCFDYADYCSNLSQAEIQVIESIKARIIGQASSYDQTNIAAVAPDKQYRHIAPSDMDDV